MEANKDWTLAAGPKSEGYNDGVSALHGYNKFPLQAL